MHLTKALFLTSAVSDWLSHSRHPRILHIFDRACNLINEHADVLSIVAPEIGNGPFNLVIEDDLNFAAHCNVDSSILMQDANLQIDNIIIQLSEAKQWSARLDWEGISAKRALILGQLAQLRIPNNRPPIPPDLLSVFATSLATADLASAVAAAKKLAGLGSGLTPSGDDFIIGSLYATWILHPPKTAGILAETVASSAAPLTTSLSAAWLRAAGRGEAVIQWHDFLDALLSTDLPWRQVAMENILATGATSGADALFGFIDTLEFYGVKTQYG